MHFLKEQIFLEKTNLHMLTNNPKLTVVGAGPGDIELFTLKGVKALQSANVVLYDALVNP